MTEEQPHLDQELGFDPDELINEGIETGYDIGSQETLEQMEDIMLDAGFDEDEIEEALYDPAPRRGRRRHGGRKARRHARSYDPAPRRRRRGRRMYDPAPRRKYRSASAYPKKGRKGKFAKFKKFVLPAATVGSFYMSYSANAKARNMTVLDALKYDLGNWSADKTMTKIQANPLPLVGAVGLPIVKGYIPGARSGVVGLMVDAVQGILTGQFVTQVIDEPAPTNAIRVVTPAATVTKSEPACPSCTFKNPYA